MIRPLIGTAAWIRKDGKIMLAQRASEKRGAGQWCPPGGHLEMHETIEECVIRETREESGVEIQNVRMMCVIEAPKGSDGTHYVTFHYVADWKSGVPRECPGECGQWHFFKWNELPEPLFSPAKQFYEKGINPLEFTD